MCGGTDRFQYTDKFGEGNYHCRGCGAVVHDATFHPADLGAQIKAMLAEFNGSEALRTCKACGEVFKN